MKRAQMEIIGLVVIVILITIGMLFMAQFALKDNSQKKIFTRKGLAYSAMSAIMKTSVDSNANCILNVDVQPQIGKDLIEDCAKNYGYRSSHYNCGGEPSCVFLNETIAKLLNETLGSWNKRYEFSSRLLGSGLPNNGLLISISSSRGGCPGTVVRDTSGLFPISTSAGLVENVLYLCD